MIIVSLRCHEKFDSINIRIKLDNLFFGGDNLTFIRDHVQKLIRIRLYLFLAIHDPLRLHYPTLLGLYIHLHQFKICLASFFIPDIYFDQIPRVFY